MYIWFWKFGKQKSIGKFSWTYFPSHVLCLRLRYDFPLLVTGHVCRGWQWIPALGKCNFSLLDFFLGSDLCSFANVGNFTWTAFYPSSTPIKYDLEWKLHQIIIFIFAFPLYFWYNDQIYLEYTAILTDRDGVVENCMDYSNADQLFIVNQKTEFHMAWEESFWISHIVSLVCCYTQNIVCADICLQTCLICLLESA